MERYPEASHSRFRPLRCEYAENCSRHAVRGTVPRGSIRCSPSCAEGFQSCCRKDEDPQHGCAEASRRESCSGRRRGGSTHRPGRRRGEEAEAARRRSCWCWRWRWRRVAIIIIVVGRIKASQRPLVLHSSRVGAAARPETPLTSARHARERAVTTTSVDGHINVSVFNHQQPPACVLPKQAAIRILIYTQQLFPAAGPCSQQVVLASPPLAACTFLPSFAAA